MTRRILFCTIGATPQVVTETVWALNKVHDPSWSPDEIHIVTTTFALADIRRELQSPEGHLVALFDGRVPPVTIHVPCRESPAVTIPPWSTREEYETTKVTDDALADVNTDSDATLMGALIFRLIARFTHGVGRPIRVKVHGKKREH